MPLLIALLLSLMTLPAWAKPVRIEVCGLQIESQEQSFQLTKTEEDWLCGTSGSPSWKGSPESQKILFLTAFLQSRGFHQPLIEYLPQSVFIQTGPQSKLQLLELQNAPNAWNWKRRRDVKNRPFTPVVLNEFTKWAQRRLQENGHPCPVVTSEAIVNEETFILKVEEDLEAIFGPVETIGETDLDPKILDRYSAYFEKKEFDIRLLEITANRILVDDLYLSAYFDIICDGKDNFKIIRRVVPAKPHLLTFGLGFDSEGGVIFRSLLKKSRLTEKADSLQINLYSSFIEQTLSAQYRHFYLEDLSLRHHLLISPSIKREKESNYETVTYQLGASLVFGWEQESHLIEAKAGPLLERLDLIADTGNERIDSLKIETEFRFLSHLYEYFLNDPQKGWVFVINTSTQFAGARAHENIHKVQLRHQILWNLWDWDPALLILAWRGWAGTYVISDGKTNTDEIPINQRFFLGGDNTLRGFVRQKLPFSNNGFLSVLYQGFELRLGKWLPYNLQPYVLFDFAKGGETANELAKENYYSLGLGMRWASPLGTVRGTLAQGFMTPDPSPSVGGAHDLMMIFSFGREF